MILSSVSKKSRVRQDFPHNNIPVIGQGIVGLVHHFVDDGVIEKGTPPAQQQEQEEREVEVGIA